MIQLEIRLLGFVIKYSMVYFTKEISLNSSHRLLSVSPFLHIYTNITVGLCVCVLFCFWSRDILSAILPYERTGHYSSSSSSSSHLPNHLLSLSLSFFAARTILKVYFQSQLHYTPQSPFYSALYAPSAHPSVSVIIVIYTVRVWLMMISYKMLAWWRKGNGSSSVCAISSS